MISEVEMQENIELFRLLSEDVKDETTAALLVIACRINDLQRAMNEVEKAIRQPC